MAVDRSLLTKNLQRFYDFTGKIVLCVGAGGKLLLDPATKIKKLIAIDQNAEALQDLCAKMKNAASASPVEVLPCRFEDVTVLGDVVYFEFCLHEIADPFKALAHAKTLAPDIVVFDHAPDSPWVFHAAEENLVRRSSDAAKRFGPRSHSAFRAEQRFATCAELLDKLKSQGPLALQRAARFATITAIVIPMNCELVLL